MTAWTSVVTELRRTALALPDAIAIEAPDAPALSYAELVSRVELMSGALHRQGASRGDVVAIDLEKSAAYVVALLACWRIGAAFMPLERGLPAERRRQMLAETRPRVVIDPGWLGAASVPNAAAEMVALEPDDLAYVIYTSGSSGTPKGVCVPHRGIASLLCAQIETFELDVSSRALWFLSTAFDASVSDVGTALLAGATLVIEPCSPGELIATLARRRITHADLPPALLRVIDPERLPATLRTLIVGGEASSPELIRRFARRVRVVNVYGPTEATVCSSACVCDAERWDRPLLGSPLPGVRYRVLESGELCIGGVGLALGYLQRPELDRERFVEVSGERMYRTGDRVLCRADGELEFVGRLDRQVKIRGRRIELEEIERVLGDDPTLVEVAVVTRTLGDRDALVAFAVPSGSEIEPSALRRSVAARLPSWMIPSRFVALERLPRTATGKPDLVALAALPLSTSPAIALPGTEGELAALFTQVLGTSPTSADDDFFELGGDSFAALELAVLAEARGLPLSIGRIASDRSVRELARSIDGRARAEPAEDADFLRADALGEAEHVGAEPRGKASGDAVLITGATGFFGARLLVEIARRTDARLLCLVRAADEPSARVRLGAAARRHGLELPEHRLEVVLGDVARPRFGLESQAWQRLAERTGCVYHSAAQVHLVASYAELRSTNLVGTAEVSRLARAAAARVHYVSTLSVFVGTDRAAGVCLEADDLSSIRRVYGGYAQSKWAAEALLRAARATPTSIYRLGLVTGDTQRGLGGERDLLARLIRGLCKLGAAPVEALELAFDVTPVDFAARAVAELSLAAADDLATHHVANRRSASLCLLIDALAAHGCELELVPAETWSARALKLAAEPDVAATFLALCRVLPGAFARQRSVDLFQATGMRFETRLQAPAPSLELLTRYVAGALECGAAS